MKVYKNVSELVGKTPLLELSNIEKELNLNNTIYGKMESFNPAGSVKDRIAKAMIDDFEKRGLVNKDTVFIEGTSGNTGIGLASICAERGYKLIIVMPETMSVERRQLMTAYGAEIVLTEGSKGMTGANQKAIELKEEYGNAIIPSQFENMVNPKTHYETTGPEIYKDLDGKVDILIAGVGTGGTISGIGKYLKEKDPNIQIIAVEPKDSPVLSEKRSGSHKIQGIGAGFIPHTLDVNIYDEVICISNKDAFKYGKLVAHKEGILVGISSGAALAAAVEVSNRKENIDKNIVIIMPDGGDRYLSTDLYK